MANFFENFIQALEYSFMIISSEKKFVFIKTMKTAGSSIEAFLAKNHLGASIVTPQFPLIPGHVAFNSEGFFDHCPAEKVRDWMGETLWDSFYSFCVERNPWEKVLSLYSMHKSTGIKDAEDFDCWLEKKIFPLNYQMYTSSNDPNKIIVNRVLRYESLISDLAEIFYDLGIPFDGSLGVNAKGNYRTDRRSAREILTPKQYNVIGDAFVHEIKLNGWY